jgi:hypothetical protein
MKESRFYVAMFGVFMILASISLWKIAQATASNGAPGIVQLPVLLMAAGLTGVGIVLLFRAAVPARELEDDSHPAEKG